MNPKSGAAGFWALDLQSRLQQLPLKHAQMRTRQPMVRWAGLNGRRQSWDSKKQLAPEVVLEPFHPLLVLNTTGEIVRFSLPLLGEMRPDNGEEGKNRSWGLCCL